MELDKRLVQVASAFATASDKFGDLRESVAHKIYDCGAFQDKSQSEGGKGLSFMKKIRMRRFHRFTLIFEPPTIQSPDRSLLKLSKLSVLCSTAWLVCDS